MLEILRSNEMYWNLFNSAAVILFVWILRMVSIRAIRRTEVILPDTKRKWMVLIQNLSFFLILAGLLMVWATQLKTIALSLVALAVALVIATKEFLLCFSGSIVKTMSRQFDIGDRVEIAGFRGDVISHNLLATTLQEIGPGKEHHQFTGRIISIPNSLFLSTAVTNESATGDFVLHVFKIPFQKSEDWRQASWLLAKICEQECAEYIATATEQFRYHSRKQATEMPHVEPRIHLSFPEPDRVDLVIRIPAPANRKGRVEQNILRAFSEQWAEVEGAPV